VGAGTGGGGAMEEKKEKRKFQGGDLSKRATTLLLRTLKPTRKI
jgi:hypothetical protein